MPGGTSALGFGPLELHPEDRIGGPLSRSYRKLVFRTALAGTLALGGWMWVNHPATVSEWTMAAVALIAPMLERETPVQAAALPELAPLRPVAVTEPVAAARTGTSHGATASLAPETETADEAAVAQSAERLPPPVADPGDPYQARALAVGLHPGISRVVLARLSATDYRNAGIAIRTALAETPDSEVFVWPSQRTPKLALFQVKFVPGAAPGCRRYVVMITMDGWLTTALPMENCAYGHAGHLAAAAASRRP